jgi:hypothetical protein
VHLTAQPDAAHARPIRAVQDAPRCVERRLPPDFRELLSGARERLLNGVFFGCHCDDFGAFRVEERRLQAARANINAKQVAHASLSRKIALKKN